MQCNEKVVLLKIVKKVVAQSRRLFSQYIVLNVGNRSH